MTTKNVYEYSKEIFESKGERKYFDERDSRDTAISIMEKYGHSKDYIERNFVLFPDPEDTEIMNDEVYHLTMAFTDLEMSYEDRTSQLFNQAEEVNKMFKELENHKDYGKMSDFKVEISESNFIKLTYKINGKSEEMIQQV